MTDLRMDENTILVFERPPVPRIVSCAASFGSAAIFSTVPAPPPPEVAPPLLPVVSDFVPPELLPVLEEELSSSPPQPTTGIAKAQSRAMREKARMEGSTHPSQAEFSR